MEDWSQDFVDMIESVADQVEQFFLDVSREVGEVVETIALISEEVAEQVQETFLGELEQCLSDLISPMLEQYLGVEHLLGEATQPLNSTVEPFLNQHPACVGCRHYHGQVYGDQMLVCGMYPYGWEGEKCPDWQSVWMD